MKATKGQAIALATVSALVLAAGIAVMVLMHTWLGLLVGSNSSVPLLSTFWPYGVPVLLTGVLGIAAAVSRTNVVMGIYMGIGITCLVVLSVFVAFFALVFFALTLTYSTDCKMIGDTCTCTFSADDVNRSGMVDCENPLHEVVSVGRATSAVVIISWILMLAGSIISCAACCCGQRDDINPGVVIAPAGGLAYEMNTQPLGYGAPVKDSGNRY